MTSPLPPDGAGQAWRHLVHHHLTRRRSPRGRSVGAGRRASRRDGRGGRSARRHEQRGSIWRPIRRLISRVRGAISRASSSAASRRGSGALPRTQLRRTPPRRFRSSPAGHADSARASRRRGRHRRERPPPRRPTPRGRPPGIGRRRAAVWRRRCGTDRSTSSAVSSVQVSASEQEVALGHGQFGGWRFGTVRRRCGPRTCRDRPRCRAWRRSCGMSALPSGGCRRPAPAAGRRPSRSARPSSMRRRATKRPSSAGGHAGRGAEHRAGQDRLRRRDRGVGVAHRGPRDHRRP